MGFVGGGNGIELSHPETWGGRVIGESKRVDEKCQFYPCLVGMMLVNVMMVL
jgi:hypothetical protein